MIEEEAVYGYCFICGSQFVKGMLPYIIQKNKETGLPIMKKNGNPVRTNRAIKHTFYNFGGKNFYNSGYCEECFRERIDDFLKIEKHQAEIEAIRNKKE